jgi:hypothetical protein
MSKSIRIGKLRVGVVRQVKSAIPSSRSPSVPAAIAGRIGS